MDKSTFLKKKIEKQIIIIIKTESKLGKYPKIGWNPDLPSDIQSIFSKISDQLLEYDHQLARIRYSVLGINDESLRLKNTIFPDINNIKNNSQLTLDFLSKFGNKLKENDKQILNEIFSYKKKLDNSLNTLYQLRNLNLNALDHNSLFSAEKKIIKDLKKAFRIYIHNEFIPIEINPKWDKKICNSISEIIKYTHSISEQIKDWYYLLIYENKLDWNIFYKNSNNLNNIKKCISYISEELTYSEDKKIVERIIRYKKNFDKILEIIFELRNKIN